MHIRVLSLTTTLLAPLLALLLTSLFSPVVLAEPVSSHGIAMYGDLKYPADFTHLEYTDPNAPKGGEVRLSSIGTFDSLHPFILKGTAPDGTGMLFDTLTDHSQDEAFSEYGLLAETIEVPEDRSWVAYTLRPEARFADGSPVTADDVLFTFNALTTQGHPFYKSYYSSVVKAEKRGERTVKFHFSEGENRELPLIMGQMPVLSKAFFDGKDFSKTSLKPLLGSGPYRVAEVEPGRSISYELRDDYWAKDLPIKRGRHNFARIRYDFYRDATVALEAFKAGEVDFRQENTSKTWATGYDFPALKDGRVIKEEIRHSSPTGMQGFFMNTRREMFSNPLTRAALAQLFDFEWTNKNLFYGAYTRTQSFFSNSELAATGLPSEAELAILEPYRDQLPKQVFTKAYQAPKTDGSGRIRPQLRQALRLFKQSGWRLKGGKLVNAKTGKPMEFEILLVSPAFERIVLPYAKNLKRAGIQAKVRTVDPTQYQNRLDSFDFDMIVGTIGQSLSPGNEQRNFWSSKAAETQGSRNWAGIKDPVVDKLIELVISAPDRQTLIDRTRALDRVLLWGHYVIPQWHIRSYRVAYWDKFDRPKTSPKYNLGFDTWWVKSQK